MSNDQIKLSLNDIDALYDAGPKIMKNGAIQCPVCEKIYQSETAAKKHVEKRNCHDLKKVIEGTIFEMKAYALYKMLLAALNDKAKVSMSTFRKSPLYKPVARFSMFCSANEVFSMDTYVAYLNEIKGIEHVGAILSEGIKEKSLADFRLFAQRMNLIPSEDFYAKYRDDLLTDDNFLVRSIEKARISLQFLASLPVEEFDFCTRMENLPADYQNRLEELINTVIGD